MSEDFGVRIERRHPASMWNVRGNLADAGFMRGAEAALGIALPGAANTAGGDDSRRAIWLAPDEWLVVSSQAAGETRIPNGTLTDVSHGRTVFRVTGRHVRDVLAKGCSLDLDRRMFAANRCAQTAIAKVNILLDHVRPEVFDLYCPRSYHGSLSHWLEDAAREYV